MIKPIKNQKLDSDQAAGKLRLVLDMQQFGIGMMRQNLIRRHPNDSQEEILRRLSEWLAYTPDIEDPRFEVRRCKSASNNS